MHVAQFVHRYPPAVGGAEAWAARLSRYLAAAGDQVTVWTTTALDLTAFTRTGRRELPPGAGVESGVTVRRFPLSVRWPGRRYVLKAASLVPVRSWQAMTQPWGPISLGMWRAAGRPGDDVDVVHAIAFPYAAIASSALRLARRVGVPFVVTPFLHLGDPADARDPVRRAYTAPHLRALLQAADRVVVQTPIEGDAVRRLGVPWDRIVLQGLGVDPTECTGGSRERTRGRWGIGPSDVVVGHLANLSPEKGTIDLLRTVDDLRRSGRPVRTVVAGPEMPSFRRYWDDAGRGVEGVIRLGPLSDADRRDFFAAIDIFALPSRSDSFGLVFLEAWSNAVPVIGYRAGGVADVIRSGVDGYLVKCGSISELATAIGALSRDAMVREKMGRAGKERIDRDFRWDDKLQIARTALTEWR